MANTSNKKTTSNKSGSRTGQSKGKTAAKEKTAPSKSSSREKSTPAREPFDKQKVAIVIFAIAVFVMCVALIEGSSLWLVCHNFLFRVFGFCAYVLPVLLVYIAIIYSNDKSIGSIAANLTEVGVLTAFITSAIHLCSNTSAYLSDTGIGVQLAEVWKNGAAEKRAGVIGALIGGGLGKLFGKTGACITVFIILIALVLFITGTSLPVLASYIRRPVKAVSRATSERIEQNNKRREIREQEEAEREKQREEEEAKCALPPLLDGEVFKPVNKPVKHDKKLDEPEMAPIPLYNLPDSTGPRPPESILPKQETAPVQPPVQEETLIPKKVTPKKTVKPKPENTVKPVPAEKAKESASLNSGKSYVFPPIECLNVPDNSGIGDSMEEMQQGARKLVSTLQSFKINAEVVNICRGPSVTRYELVPEAGVRISKITTLADDIALRLAAQSVRIEAPIPGKSAIGIEIPNGNKSMVSVREVIDTDIYRAGSLKSKLNVALGKDITGNVITADLSKMPHLLVAGTTGSGKSVCMNAMIISILYNAAPDEVKLLMIDPKQVEFTVYNGIAHLEVPVVSDPRKAAGALSWAVGEMTKRYKMFSENRVRDIKGYNNLVRETEGMEKMHHIVIFIDELSDLMMAAPKEVEDSICRLAQMARAAGIHLVIATQSPRADIITGLIKANIPSRLALKVANPLESRIIFDEGGAEKLLGNGDLLFKPVGVSKPTRIQGCYISEDEVSAVVNHIKAQYDAAYNDETMREIEAKAAASQNQSGGDDDDDFNDLDPMFDEAAEVVIIAGQASTTMLQKKLKLGYARASRVMDQLEENGIVGPSEGAKPRQVLVTKQQWYEKQALAEGSVKKEEQMTFDTVESAETEEYEEEYEEETGEEPVQDEISGDADDEEPPFDIDDGPQNEPDEESSADENPDEEDDGEQENDSFDFLDDEDEDYVPTSIDEVFYDDEDYAGIDEPFYEE